MIRHVLTPSISYSYRPDFGLDRYGYYDDYQLPANDGTFQKVRYARYENTLYGMPGTGKSGSIGISVSNNVEMKMKQVTDTGEVDKKVSLIDQFSFGTSYKLAADSLNWSDISVSLRIKFGKWYTLNLSTSLDPYMYQLNASGQPVRVNQTTMEKLGIPGRMTGIGTSFNYTLSDATFKKKPKGTSARQGSSLEGDVTQEDQSTTTPPPSMPALPDDPEAALYEPLKVPWSISFNYSLRYARSTFNKQKMYYDYDFMQNLSLQGNISLFEKWRVTASTSYNFQYKEFADLSCNVYRDLHCWEMGCSFRPIGRYKSYNFYIRVKSSMLKDLKYEQHQNPWDTQIWGY
jgi:hypothetical protein